MGWGMLAGVGNAMKGYGSDMQTQANTEKQDALRAQKEAADDLMRERIYERSRADSATDRKLNSENTIDTAKKLEAAKQDANARDYAAVEAGVGGATQEERANLMQNPEALAIYKNSSGMLNAGKDKELMLELQLAEARKTGNKDVISDLEGSLKELRSEKGLSVSQKSTAMKEAEMTLLPARVEMEAAQKRYSTSLDDVTVSNAKREQLKNDAATAQRSYANQAKDLGIGSSLGGSKGKTKESTTTKLDDLFAPLPTAKKDSETTKAR